MNDQIVSKGITTLRTEGAFEFIKGSVRFSIKQIVPDRFRRRYCRQRYPLPNDLERYDNPPDPFEPLTVEVDDIQYLSGREYPPYFGNDARLGVVMGGNWDRTDPDHVDPAYEPRYRLYRNGANRFTDCLYYHSLENHFCNNISWEETKWYQRCVDFIDSGKSVTKGIDTRSGLQLRCSEIDRLYDKIAKEGYKTQSELGDYPVAAREIIIDIGRNGTPLFVNGRNRLAIANILDIDTVPVGVYVRHEKWMVQRERVLKSSSPTTTTPLANHPDLRGAAPSN